MNRKGSLLRRAQLPIDVTALLDVVFLVLLIVICRQQSLTTAESARAAEVLQTAGAAQAEAEAARALYAERLETAESLSAYVSVLTIYVDYTPGNPRERHIRLLDDTADAGILNIDLSPGTEQAAYGELEALLRERIDGAEGRPVILSLDLTHILYRDEEAVNAALLALQEEYGNLYFK